MTGRLAGAPLPAGFDAEVVLNCSQVARLLQVPESSVSNLHRLGALPGILIGRHLRWLPATLSAYLQSLEGEHHG